MAVSSVLFAAALLQQAVTPPQGSAAGAPADQPSLIARIIVTPARPVVRAGDTLRLSARAVDASGNAVPGARIMYLRSGAWFEGIVDSTGLVSAGSPGVLPVTVVAVVPGSKPARERIEVRMVPGPAARVALARDQVRIVVGQRLRVAADVFSHAGDRAVEAIAWRSSNPAIVSVEGDGVLVARAAGRATVRAGTNSASASMSVQVINGPLTSLEITPSTTEARQGDVIRFSVTGRDRNGARVSGLTPTWSFSPGHGMIDADGAFVGYEPGTYSVIATAGARVAEATVSLTTRDVRRAVTVVGRLPRTRFTTEEVWVHPNGKYAYLGTGSGGDVMYTLDISDPAKPRVTDSVIANTRRVNDVMTTPDGKHLVFTREGASDRKNGIVIASLEDPAHPKPIAEFTEGVTAGVHSAFVYRQEKFGTHVYLTNDGTAAMHVVDITDPAHPREVAQWRSPTPNGGGSLHDIDVQDGLAYLSNWNDGLIILDVGNGMKGGSPSNPVFVSQYKYDLNALYRDVEAASGPGFIRGTHTAWRHRNYVIIADEVFPASGVKGAKDAAVGRAYGRLQVLDVSNIERPKSVAWFEPDFGGVHNVWVAGDTLYLGAYNGGFHAFDISGELRGDLKAQKRLMAHLNTADMEGKVQNTAMTWGVVVKDGLAYVNDMYNGLWIVRMEPRSGLTP